MLSNAHSRTAEATAAIRACHFQHDSPLLFVDPYAVHLTSPGWRMVCRHRWLYRVVVRGLLSALRPIHGWILVRDCVTEEVLRRFTSDGGKQFVLLGAGFDSTALRRPAWLDAVSIYEIDHPATQAVKLARIAALEGTAASAEFEAIAIDFEHERLGDGLARSNFVAAAPALFAWQGVIYYLSGGAIKDTLRELGSLAAPGSELLFDFLLPEWTLEAGSGRALSFARLFTARLGERYVSYHTVEDVRALLAEAGFEVLSIRLDAELERAYLSNRADGLTAMRGFGIVHARKCALRQ